MYMMFWQKRGMNIDTAKLRFIE
ncbi:hypothetical protein CGLO_12452 [Colletotrichum gloeosporioides Cg-14]|uniref:Uncharacterized protein n=1 Tax=Colletotrichum gloeosporioides (strain Cg-14) TaxID=1237896 RepID=T0K8G1_COLGC|nr:hypothetical protein CGLO_12452 [Colletotrichum gloeosporioides Cg-14]